jgi:hypothetical protein
MMNTDGQRIASLEAENAKLRAAGLLRMQTDTELLGQERACRCQRCLGFLTPPTNDDEVICPSRQPIAGFGHRVIKRREIDVRP